MILADENVHSFIIKTLREAGFDISYRLQFCKRIQRFPGEYLFKWTSGSDRLCGLIYFSIKAFIKS